jgi:hypothetical protein
VKVYARESMKRQIVAKYYKLIQKVESLKLFGGEESSLLKGEGEEQQQLA